MFGYYLVFFYDTRWCSRSAVVMPTEDFAARPTNILLLGHWRIIDDLNLDNVRYNGVRVRLQPVMKRNCDFKSTGLALVFHEKIKFFF